MLLGESVLQLIVSQQPTRTADESKHEEDVLQEKFEGLQVRGREGGTCRTSGARAESGMH